MRSTISLRLPSLAIVLTMLVGCGGQTASFPGHTDPEVWNAMVTVAENPEYQDWRLSENWVTATRPEGRIEIYRILRRDRVQPGRPPRRQQEDWNITVQFLYSDPPTIEFMARDASIPAHAWAEADRYFEGMRRVLAGARVTPQVEAPESIEGAGEMEEEPTPTSADALEQLLDGDQP